jgi:phosphonate transport system permease protein
MKENGKRLKHFLFDVLLWTYAVTSLYKIIYQNYILQVRYLEYHSQEFIFCLIAGAILSFLFSLIPQFSIFQGFSHKTNTPYLKRPYFILFLFILIITFINGIHFSQFSLREFFSESGMDGAKRIFWSLLHPNFDILGESLKAAVETVFMAFMATALAIPFSFILSFFAAKNLTRSSLFFKIIYTSARFVLNGTRSIEPLVWAIIFSVWVGIGPFAGMLALCLHSVASLSKLYSEQIENINEGPLDAIRSTGAHPVQVIWFGVVPQIILPFLSFTIYRWDINVRMATVIGLVGGGGIGTMLMQYQGTARWNEVGLLIIIIALIVWAMDTMSSKIREKIK